VPGERGSGALVGKAGGCSTGRREFLSFGVRWEGWGSYVLGALFVKSRKPKVVEENSKLVGTAGRGLQRKKEGVSEKLHHPPRTEHSLFFPG